MGRNKEKEDVEYRRKYRRKHIETIEHRITPILKYMGKFVQDVQQAQPRRSSLIGSHRTNQPHFGKESTPVAMERSSTAAYSKPKRKACVRR